MLDLLQIAGQFEIQGQPISITKYGTGHIHDTYLLESKGENKIFRYILQRINTYVFKDPEAVMRNLILITDHLKKRKTGNQVKSFNCCKYLDLIKTLKADSFYSDNQRNYWRCFVYIPDTITYDRIEQPHLAFEGGKLYGNFIFSLSDLSPHHIRETIPGFHNVKKRFEQYESAIQRDVAKRRTKAEGEIRKIRALEEIADIYLKVEKDLPERIVHNDTKINNVLFLSKTGKGICVIDLDTVMPGSLLFDFGDMVRSFTNAANEDEKDLSAVYCRIDIFEELVKGFIPEVVEIITKTEKENLIQGCKLMIYMQAVRFLTDYLECDIYYKISYEEHNLIRARNQLKLLETILSKERLMNEIIHRYL